MPLRGAAPRQNGRTTRAGYRAVGRVERPWGLQGNLKVEPLTDFPERFEVGERVFLDGIERTVLSSRWQKGRVYLRLEGLDTPEAGERFRDALLEVPEDDRPAFDENEYYIDEVVGSRVERTTGELVGVVREVLQPGANDVFVVGREGQRDLLVPAIRDVVLTVDIEAKRIEVDLPDSPDQGRPLIDLPRGRL